jgi:hypothetical protein
MSVAIELMAVPKYGPIVLRLIGAPRYILTHYGKKKGWPCPGEDLCPAHDRPILKGYAPALAWNSERGAWMPVVHELTEAAIELVGPEPLLGVCWEFQRLNVGKKVRQVTGHLLESEPLSEVVDAWDVVPIVERLYRTDRIAWDVSPALYARVTGPVVMGSAPPIKSSPAKASEDKVPSHRFREFLDRAKSAGQNGTRSPQ